MKTYVALLMISISLQAQNINLNRVHKIEAKIGLADYPIDKTTLPEIIAAFGDNYEQVPNLYYSNGKVKEGYEETPPLVEIKYKTMGISFYYFGGDSTQIIKAVRFSKPFMVKTKKNIILNKSTLGDVLNRYNNNTEISISITNDSKREASIYRQKMTSTGISFSSNLKELGSNIFPANKKLKNQIIDEIYISNINYLNRDVIGK